MKKKKRLSIDNPFFVFMGRLADVVLANLFAAIAVIDTVLLERCSMGGAG